jgi:hypothetical protein
MAVLTFARSSIARDVASLHPTLWQIVRELADGMWFEYTSQENMIVTEMFRTHDETVRIYTEAGLTPPAASVHEAVRVLGDPWSGCRGADISVRMARPGMRYQDWSYLPSTLIRACVTAINKRWRYQESEAHQVALFHDIAGLHVHLQVRSGQETIRRTIA